MNNPYDPHSWSKLYREEALREAQTRRLARQAQSAFQPRGLGRVNLAWTNALASLRIAARTDESPALEPVE